MSELPHILPTGPVPSIRPLKPISKQNGQPKRPNRDQPRRKVRDRSEPGEDPCETLPEDGEPGKGSSINLLV